MVLVRDELRAAVLRRGELVQRVDGAALALLRLDFQLVLRGRGVVRRPGAGAGRGLAPDLARPITAESDAQDEALRRHDVVRVRAARGVAEGIVGDDPTVPAVGVRLAVLQIGGDLGLGDEEDLGEGRRAVHGEGPGATRPLLAREVGPLVRRAAEGLARVAVFGQAVVLLAAILEGVGVRHAAILIHRGRVELALAADMERGHRPLVVDVLQDVHLAAHRPWLPHAQSVEGRPDAAAVGHVRELHDRQEVLPSLFGADLGSLALVLVLPAGHPGAEDGMGLRGLGDPHGPGLLEGAHKGRGAVVAVAGVEVEAVEEGVPLGLPIEPERRR
mmetsp:Transcript_51102/g.148733  ORF Transcript_51102/g.148733 Transcript_51102/m.148733 type:complete len:331 (+) Transcript_51102:490-1482(+)